jgi:formylglycine-generating enzyme required for sulfatase activity
MSNHRENPVTLTRVAWWALAVAAGLLVVYLISASIWARLREPAPYDAEINLLRRLAASDVARLAETLDHSAVHIGAGDFTMGSDMGRDDERPQHVVYLDAFEMDRYEVTNAQYRRFLEATDRNPPPYWSSDDYPAGQADYPVVGVSWEDADAYCAWAGMRLPTEAEWEKACRGTDGRIYPWGNTWDPHRANVDVSAHALPSAGHTEFEASVWDAAWQLLQATPSGPGKPGLRPIGSYPDGASPYGIMDLVGNASEWVADWYNWGNYSNMPTRNPRNMEPPWNRCLRGGPWHDPTGSADWIRNMSRCSARNSSHIASESLDPRVGFRCAHSLQ